MRCCRAPPWPDPPPRRPPPSAPTAIIQTAAGTPKPLDAAAKLLTRVTGIEKVARVFYGLGGRLIDRLTPETVKAGIVSDYGVPEAVIDQRHDGGRQREHLRQVGVLLSKLSTMTRAESRVAYEVDEHGRHRGSARLRLDDAGPARGIGQGAAGGAGPDRLLSKRKPCAWGCWTRGVQAPPLRPTCGAVTSNTPLR